MATIHKSWSRHQYPTNVTKSSSILMFSRNVRPPGACVTRNIAWRTEQGQEGGREAERQAGWCSERRVSVAVALRKGDGAARWNCHRKKREREREIPVSPFVLRTHRILACRQPSVEWRERERESTFSFRGSRTIFT